MKKTRFKIQWAMVCSVLIVFLAGCGGLAFSPETAVQQQIFDSPMRDFQADPNSYRLLQNVEMGDSRFILASVEGTRVNSGRESCVFLYQTYKMFGGWVAGSGGGGCSNEVPDPDTRPISIGANMASGRDQNDPGYSTVSGLIFKEEISTVRVTWNDGQQQDASIANQSFLASRVGNPNFTKIECFDSQGNAIFVEESNPPAPGKQ